MRNINRTRSPDQIDFPDINQVVEDNFRDTDGNLSWANAPRYNLRALNNIWDSSYLEVLPIWKGFLAKTEGLTKSETEMTLVPQMTVPTTSCSLSFEQERMNTWKEEVLTRKLRDYVFTRCFNRFWEGNVALSAKWATEREFWKLLLNAFATG
jgi:hypothetical protein